MTDYDFIVSPQEQPSDISVHAPPCWFITQKFSVNMSNKECEFLSIHGL